MAKIPKKGKVAQFRAMLENKYDSDYFSISDSYRRLSTGSLTLDSLTGGGLVEGTLIEIFGLESSGKSTTATLICKSAQALYPDKAVMVIDTEQVWNHEYSKGYGIDYDEEKFFFAQPQSGEEALQMMQDACESGLFSVIILDTIAAMLTKRQLSGDIGDSTIGELARLMSSSLPHIARSARMTGTTCVFLNQLRVKVGGFNPVPGAVTYTTPGGGAMRYYASLRLEIKKVDILLDSSKKPYGQIIKNTIRKNKFGNPYGNKDVSVFFNDGYRIKNELLDVLYEEGILEGRGAWTYYKDMKWNGRKALEIEMNNDEELYNLLLSELTNLTKKEIPYSIPEDESSIEVIETEDEEIVEVVEE